VSEQVREAEQIERAADTDVVEPRIRAGEGIEPASNLDIGLRRRRVPGRGIERDFEQ
jgi:hypothetical protein